MSSPFGGGIKFFKKSKCLFADGNTISATTGNAGAHFAIDRNPITFWRSVASNDLTTETITINFTESVVLNRLFLIDHNWKDFNIKYNLASVWTHFANVKGIDGNKTNITETVFADDSAYYEFTPVTTDSIQISVLKTQTANVEKYISQIVATESLGTLNGFPQIRSVTIDRSLRKKQMLSGKILVQKSEESFMCEINFASYPGSSPYGDDVDLIFSLHDMEENFLVWLCGGRRGSSYFKKQLRGYRLKDLFEVQMTDVLKPVYSDNIFKNSVNFTVKLEEAVD